MLLTKRTWVELQAKVKEAFMRRWTEENQGRCALYYIHDLVHSLEPRADVGSQEQLGGYLAFSSSRLAIAASFCFFTWS